MGLWVGDVVLGWALRDCMSLLLCYILRNFIWIFGYVYVRSDSILLKTNPLYERRHTGDCDEALFCGFNDSEKSLLATP